MTQNVPVAIRRFVTRTRALADDAKRIVIEQRGTMRLEANGKWLPFTAEQWMAVREIGFCWHARVKMAPFVTAVVEDKFEDGHGQLDAKLWGALPVAHDDGPAIDRGEIQRYLAELPWNPGALLHNRELQFEERPEGAVRVWTGEPTLYVDLFFDAAGDVVRTFCDNRPFQERGPSAWQGRFSEYADHGGLRIPTCGEVTWLLPEGPFEYWRGTVTSHTTER
jgi:hypothetical protein